MSRPELLEQYVSLGIFVLATTLTLLSALAWRRERDGRMGVVAVGYGLFAVYGFVVFLEHLLVPYYPPVLLELLEHGVSVLILGGLLTFFVALARE